MFFLIRICDFSSSYRFHIEIYMLLFITLIFFIFEVLYLNFYYFLRKTKTPCAVSNDRIQKIICLLLTGCLAFHFLWNID